MSDRHPITIHVQHGSEVAEIQTDGLNTILSLQEEIEETWGIPIQQQWLRCTVLINKKSTPVKTEYTLQEVSGRTILTASTFKPNAEIQAKLTEAIQAVDAVGEPQNRKSDADLMNEMVLAAKHGDFTKVFDILERKKYLINGIPAERHWSALHQAVFKADWKIVQLFLNYENCDVKVKAKRDPAGITQYGENPAELAKLFNYHEIETLLLAKSQNSLAHSPTFVVFDSAEKYMQEGLPLFWLCFAFMPANMVHSLNDLQCSSFYSLTKQFLSLARQHFQDLKHLLADMLYSYSTDLYHLLCNTSTFVEFQKCLIGICSIEHVYAQVNESLRRSSEQSNPMGEDLLLCLYAFTLEAILLHWEQLKPYEGICYRGCTLTEAQLYKYKPGEKFMWMSFTSSSKSAAAPSTGNVKFIIDNQCVSKWSPREIDAMSIYKGEFEVLYPAGAKFQVTETCQKRSTLEIRLKLLE